MRDVHDAKCDFGSTRVAETPVEEVKAWCVPNPVNKRVADLGARFSKRTVARHARDYVEVFSAGYGGFDVFESEAKSLLNRRPRDVAPVPLLDRRVERKPQSYR